MAGRSDGLDPRVARCSPRLSAYTIVSREMWKAKTPTSPDLMSVTYVLGLNPKSCTQQTGGLCGAFNARVDFAAERPKVDWFGQQRLSTVLQSLPLRLRIAIGGDHDDWHIWS